MQDRANAAKWRLWRIPQRLPDDLQSVLVGEFYEILVKEFINEKYTKAVNILKDTLKNTIMFFIVWD